jgi:hypothetical protein
LLWIDAVFLNVDPLFPYCDIPTDGDFLVLDSTDASEAVDRPFDLLLANNSPIEFGRIGAGFRGRPALYSVDGVLEYIENVLYTTSAAHNRRRTDQKTTIGISLSDLNFQLKSLFPLVRYNFPNLDNTTIRRMGEAVHKGRKSAISYHNVIPMRRISLENNEFEFTDASHDSFCQVSLICEQLFLAHGLGDNLTVISMDDSAEEHLGACCTFVSRYPK